MATTANLRLGVAALILLAVGRVAFLRFLVAAGLAFLAAFLVVAIEYLLC